MMPASHRRTGIAIAAMAASLSITIGGASREHGDLGRDTLDPNDGWASFGSGTTGGSAAAADHVYVVTSRNELVAALNEGIYPPPSNNPSNTPKIVYVAGTIDANVDDAGNPLACTDYYRNGYTREAYLATYDPAVWGVIPPTGPLEAARVASQQAQQARVRIRVGSNTTIVGLDDSATIRGAWFDIRGTAGVAGSRTNIIVRNLRFEDTFDCFPAWTPTDGPTGNWNSQYDSISLRDSDHVWIDHNDFADVATADALLPTYFGRPFQVHDGELDITNASNYVTASWNRFRDHDKVMLIGSSDSATADRGKLKVTLHHNLFSGVGQRTPRVRFGQVHVYNNYYELKHDDAYQYSWGVGIESAIFAESNFFRTDRDVTPDRFITRLNGTAIVTLETQLNAASGNHAVDVRAEFNAINDPDLSDVVGWIPVLFLPMDPAFKVPSAVISGAGPFKWH
jgi:pectate lyase